MNRLISQELNITRRSVDLPGTHIQEVLMNRMQDEQVPERMKEIGPAPPYLTPAEVAQRWRKHPSTIRRMFRDHPGTLKFGKAGHRYSKREYVELLIPESLVREMERSKLRGSER